MLEIYNPNESSSQCEMIGYTSIVKLLLWFSYREQFILLVLEVFCEIEADQESNSWASGGLRTWFIGVVFDVVDEILGRLRPCGKTR